MSTFKAASWVVAFAAIYFIVGHLDFQDSKRLAGRDYGVHLVCATHGFGESVASARPLAPQLQAALASGDRIDLVDPFKRHLFQCVRES